MKIYKWFLAIVLLAIALFAPIKATAQNHLSESFLAGGITSLTATNGVNPTNLLYALSSGTNLAGLTFTNQGVKVTHTTNTATAYLNVFKDVALWSDREGRPYSLLASNTISSTEFNTPVSLCIKTISGAVADSAVTFVFAPVYNEDVGEVTGTTVQFSTSVTPLASSVQTWAIPVPVYRWPGAKKLRLLYISNADTTSGDGSVKIQHLSLNGFRP